MATEGYCTEAVGRSEGTKEIKRIRVTMTKIEVKKTVLGINILSSCLERRKESVNASEE